MTTTCIPSSFLSGRPWDRNTEYASPYAERGRSAKTALGSLGLRAGQRCLAGSNVVPVGNVAEEFIPALVEAASRLVVGNGLDDGVTMGPLISQSAKERGISYVERGVREGGQLLLDGRLARVPQEGYFLGPTILDQVQPKTAVASDEIFGPLIAVLRAPSLEQAIELVNASPYGNSAIIYTESGKAAREFAYDVDCGEMGVNVGLAVPMAYFPFGGRKGSFFGILHGQGQDAVDFFTDKKIIIERWWA